MLTDDAPGSSTRRGPDTEPRFKERVYLLLRRRWPILVLVAIAAAAFLIRLYYLSLHSEYTADSYYFLILARSIRDTFTYTVRGVAHSKYLPGYPVLIWVGNYIFGGFERSANLIALTGGSLTVFTTYLLGKELFNRWAGLLAALIIAFQPTFLKWTCLPMTEGMFTFLFTLGLYLMLTGTRRASPARRITGMAMGGLCLLTRWEGILFLPLAVLILLMYYRDSRLRWWEPAVMLVLFGGPIGIYVLRNKIATGRVTAYLADYERQNEITYALLKHRFKVYAWQGMSDALFYVFFYLGALLCLIRKKWKPFLLLGGWVALFVLFHMFWYYTYERFMAPAVPAVAIMIGFFLVEIILLARGFLASERGSRLSNAARSAIQVSGYIVVTGLLVLLVAHGLLRANTVIEQNYKAFADDHGGRGMVEASDWLKDNAPGQIVAVDAGPYFFWEYGTDVLYVRPVPWDLPVEDRDVNAPDLAEKLYQRGIRYLVIGQTEEGVEAELVTLGMRPEDVARLREVARWENRYDFPEPHDLSTVIFEVLPPS